MSTVYSPYRRKIWKFYVLRSRQLLETLRLVTMMNVDVGETLMLIHDKDYFVLVLIYYTK